MPPNSSVGKSSRHCRSAASCWLTSRWLTSHRALFVFVSLVAGSMAAVRTAHSVAPPTTQASEKKADQLAFRTESIRGQVVWLAEALRSEFGISTVPEVAENSLAILTPDGQLVPIAENLRGRAFRKDKRLRGKEMEILARRYQQQPLIQVLRIYQLEDGQRYEVDYWCDVCAIVMYETGPCACCQDDNRLRKRLVDENDDGKQGGTEPSQD